MQTANSEAPSLAPGVPWLQAAFTSAPRAPVKVGLGVARGGRSWQLRWVVHGRDAKLANPMSILHSICPMPLMPPHPESLTHANHSVGSERSAPPSLAIRTAAFLLARFTPLWPPSCPRVAFTTAPFTRADLASNELIFRLLESRSSAGTLLSAHVLDPDELPHPGECQPSR